MAALSNNRQKLFWALIFAIIKCREQIISGRIANKFTLLCVVCKWGVSTDVVFVYNESVFRKFYWNILGRKYCTGEYIRSITRIVASLATIRFENLFDEQASCEIRNICIHRFERSKIYSFKKICENLHCVGP